MLCPLTNQPCAKPKPFCLMQQQGPQFVVIPVCGDCLQQPIPDLRCPQCGLTAAEFLKHYKFGCEQCYIAFADLLKQLLPHIQPGSQKHCGKKPTPIDQDLMTAIQALRAKLDRDIQQERFEICVQLRDALRILTDLADKQKS